MACVQQRDVLVSPAKRIPVDPLPPPPRATPLTDDQTRIGHEEPHALNRFPQCDHTVELCVVMRCCCCCCCCCCCRCCCCCCCRRRRRGRHCAHEPLSSEPLKAPQPALINSLRTSCSRLCCICIARSYAVDPEYSERVQFRN